MQTYPLGIDVGNSETCGAIIVDGKMFTDHIPSVTSHASSKRAHEFGIRKGLLFKDDSAELYVGRLAMEQSYIVYSTMGDIERYTSIQSRRLMLTMAAHLLGNAGATDGEFSLNVVTGLPVDTFINSPELRKSIKKLNGTYEFSLNGRDYTAHVNMARVLMEGAGAMATRSVDSDSINAVLDIGGRTTDLYVTRGQTPLEKLCTHKPIGVATASELINRSFEDERGVRIDNLRLMDVLHAYARGGKLPPVKVDGKEVENMRELIRNALREVGEQIVSFVASVWNESEIGKVASSFDSVVIIGGGAHYFKDVILRRIPHATVADNPEMSNAVGYAKVAELILQRSK